MMKKQVKEIFGGDETCCDIKFFARRKTRRNVLKVDDIEIFPFL